MDSVDIRAPELQITTQHWAMFTIWNKRNLKVQIWCMWNRIWARFVLIPSPPRKNWAAGRYQRSLLHTAYEAPIIVFQAELNTYDSPAGRLGDTEVYVHTEKIGGLGAALGIECTITDC